MASNAFADYLRRRRTELLPSDVGLPSGGRRRTPGLRREEVAVRAGVSADYLARLEQGRDTNPSAAVVEALADALLLDDKERAVFGWLALTSSHAGRCPESPPAPDRVPETIETILAALEPNPAFVLGRRLDVLGWNNAWADFVTPLGMLDDPAEVNLAHYTYTHPMARRVLRNWAETAESSPTRYGAPPCDGRVTPSCAAPSKPYASIRISTETGDPDVRVRICPVCWVSITRITVGSMCPSR